MNDDVKVSDEQNEESRETSLHKQDPTLPVRENMPHLLDRLDEIKASQLLTP